MLALRTLLLLSLVACGSVAGESDPPIAPSSNPVPPASEDTTAPGVAWLLAPPPGSNVDAYSRTPIGSSRNDVWLLQDIQDADFAWHWDGRTWSKIPLPFRSIHAIHAAASVAPGVIALTVPDCGSILRLDADARATWIDSQSECPPTIDDLDASQDAIVVTKDGKALSIEGSDFVALPEAAEPTRGLRVVAKNDVWAMRPVMHFDGMAWKKLGDDSRLSNGAAFLSGAVYDVDDLALFSPAWAHRGPPVDDTASHGWKLRKLDSSGALSVTDVPLPSDIPMDGTTSYTGMFAARTRSGELALAGCVLTGDATFTPDLTKPFPGRLVAHSSSGAPIALPSNLPCPLRDHDDATRASAPVRPLLDGTWMYRAENRYVLVDP
jgi:hypothetical protein